MAAVWPSSLPQYVLEAGYQETLEDQVVESGMDTGPVKIRRRFTTNVRRFQVVVQMTPEQMVDFENFYLNTCGAGSVAFEWVHPRTRVAKTFRFRKPVPTVTVAASGAIVRVQLNLETVP